MTPEQFCYWLRGYFELHEKGVHNECCKELSAEQVRVISEHLKSVFDIKIMNSTPPIIHTPLDFDYDVVRDAK